MASTGHFRGWTVRRSAAAKSGADAKPDLGGGRLVHPEKLARTEQGRRKPAHDRFCENALNRCPDGLPWGWPSLVLVVSAVWCLREHTSRCVSNTNQPRTT
jgi:hypothetical protein